MAGKSERDTCFGDAVDAYNDAHPNDELPVEPQKPWVLDNGAWRPMTTMEKIWNFITGGEPYRVPDWTMTVDGKEVAGDNKFSGDKFSNRKGRSRKTQLQDQNDMNNQTSPGKKEYQDLNLNPENCGCNEDPQPLEVYDPMLALDPGYVPMVPQTAPGVGPVPMPIRIPIRVPLGGPIFVP